MHDQPDSDLPKLVSMEAKVFFSQYIMRNLKLLTKRSGAPVMVLSCFFFQEKSNYLHYQKIMREIEHLTRLYIAYEYIKAEVSLIISRKGMVTQIH